MSKFSTSTPTDEDRDFCESICKSTSVLGFGLIEGREPNGLVAFVWQTPHGQKLYPPSATNQRQGLINACRFISDKITSYV